MYVYVYVHPKCLFKAIKRFGTYTGLKKTAEDVNKNAGNNIRFEDFGFDLQNMTTILHPAHTHTKL